MKKIMTIIVMIFTISVLFACGKKSQGDVVKQLGSKLEKVEKFEVDAVMEIKELNKTHTFDVNIKYKSPNLYKVTLKNRDSNNVQIVLKNGDGVFVLTPALNKSFKFQSDWPLNSSQPYLFQSLVKDIVNDNNAVFVKQNGTYVFETKVDYRRSHDLTSQRIVIDEKTLFPKEVVVFDTQKTEKIKVMFSDVNYKPKFNDNEYQVEYSMTSAINMYKDQLPTFVDREIMWPTFLSEGTQLAQEKVKDVAAGKRAIMNFEGTAAFTLVEEYVNVSEDMDTDIIYGDPVIMACGVAFQTQTDYNGNVVSTLTWFDNGIEFYIASDTIGADEIYTIANSFMQEDKK